VCWVWRWVMIRKEGGTDLDKLSAGGEERCGVVDVFEDFHGAYYIEAFWFRKERFSGGVTVRQGGGIGRWGNFRVGGRVCSCDCDVGFGRVNSQCPRS